MAIQARVPDHKKLKVQVRLFFINQSKCFISSSPLENIFSTFVITVCLEYILIVPALIGNLIVAVPRMEKSPQS